MPRFFYFLIVCYGKINQNPKNHYATFLKIAMRFLNVAMCVGRGARGKCLYAIFLEKKLKNNFLRVSNIWEVLLMGK